MINAFKKASIIAGNWYAIPIFLLIYNVFFSFSIFNSDEAIEQTISLNIPFLGLMMLLIFLLLGYSNMFLTAASFGQSRKNAFKLVTLSSFMSFVIFVLTDAITSYMQVRINILRGIKTEFIFEFSLSMMLFYIIVVIMLISLCSLINLLAVKYRWVFAVIIIIIFSALVSIGFYSGYKIASGSIVLPEWMKSGDFDVVLNNPIVYAGLIAVTLVCYFFQWQIVKKQSFDK